MKKEKQKRLLMHLIWLFLIGAVSGYVLETFWYIIKKGKLINKQGLWYGPFKPIYGLGLVLTTASLYKIKDKKAIWVFLAGCFVGSAFEYIASLFQEIVFGTSTWSYKSLKYNINGRIYLPYCFAWGVISLLWMKFGYKYYEKLFNKYYNKTFKFISTIILIFMIYDIALTWAITDRYAERCRKIAPENELDKIIDENFPNYEVKEKFPKLKVNSSG